MEALLLAGLAALLLPLAIVVGVGYPPFALARFAVLVRKGNGPAAKLLTRGFWSLAAALTLGGYALAGAWLTGYARMPRAVVEFLEQQGLLVLVPLLLLNLVAVNALDPRRALERFRGTPEGPTDVEA